MAKYSINLIKILNFYEIIGCVVLQKHPICSNLHRTAILLNTKLLKIEDCVCHAAKITICNIGDRKGNPPNILLYCKHERKQFKNR